MKKIREFIGKWEAMPYIERRICIKILVEPVIHRMNANPIKIPVLFFTELEKNNKNVYKRTQKSLKSQFILSKKEHGRRNGKQN